jgi:hypothetical protein
MPTALTEWEAIGDAMFLEFAPQVESVTYRQTVPGVYNGLTDTSDGVDVDFAVDMAIITETSETDPVRTNKCEGIVLGNQMRIGLGTADPSTIDKIIRASTVYTITKIERIPESGSPVIYKIHFATGK